MAGNTWDAGQKVRVSATFALAGVNTDPATVTARVRAPDQTISVYVYGTDSALVKDGTGLYHVDIMATEVGQYVYRFEGAGVVDGAAETSFYTRTSAFYS